MKQAANYEPATRQTTNVADGPEQSGQPAVVVFAGATTLRWLRLLRPGFRHCFVAVGLGHGWVILDPLSHKTSLAVVEGYSAEELVRWYESHGLIAVQTVLRDAPVKMAPLAPATCVEAVKRVLGIHAWPIITPRQLYDFILAHKIKSLDLGTTA